MSSDALATPERARDLLVDWLASRLTPESHAWFDDKRAKLEADKDFYLAFALVTRKLGKQDLALSPAELEQAQACRPGWNPTQWTVDQAARLVLLLDNLSPEVFTLRLDKLCVTGDVGELVTLYEALPIYPHPEELTKRAAEGLRTNIKAVFEAIAHHNPYPADHLEEGPWNQMVLKTLFIGSTLHPIQRLEQRANESLARILIDYAHERLAAHRAVTPELWRCISPWLQNVSDADLDRAWNTSDPLEKQGVALAFAHGTDARAKAMLAQDGELSRAIQAGTLTWQSVHESFTKPRY